MNIAICDSAAPTLERALTELAFELGVDVRIDTYGDFSALREAFGGKSYDLVLLETFLEGKSGIEFGTELREGKHECEIIFISAGTQDAYAAYAAFPIGYVVKPISKKRLRPAFTRAASRHAGKRAVILDSADRGKVTLGVDEIRYIEVIGTELFVHTRVGLIKCIGSLAETCQMLPEGKYYRSHRSFIVNMDYVVRVGRYFFTMDNGDKVTVAKNRYAEAKKKLNEYYDN